MKRTAILGNDLSSERPSREELVVALHREGIQPYYGRIWDGKANDYYCEDNAILMPIIASRNNMNPVKEIKSLVSVAKQVSKNRIDSVIVYGVKNHAAMAIGARFGGAKHILCVVNGSGNLFRVSGIKGSIIRLMAFPMLRIAYRLCSSICFQNSDDRVLFEKKRLITRRYDTFVTAGSGVNLDNYPFFSLPKENRFLYLSRITPTKGIKEYCDAARIVKQTYQSVVFDVVGTIDTSVESEDVKKIIESAENEGVISYHGYTSHVSDWIKKCRYFVYPSYYPEGVPRSALQGLSTGRPIITCDNQGCRETVKNGVNGLLVPPRNHIALADMMIWMIDHSSEVEQMAIESRKYAEERFNVHSINNEIISHLYKKG